MENSLKGSEDVGRGNSWETIAGISLLCSAVQGREIGWRETSESSVFD